jgi:glycosyltransferase involved in cell wall biosynthesis
MRIAYLLSEYPAIPHTYLLREVRELRNRGWAVEVISIRRCDRPPDRLTADEREELDRTEYILPIGAARALGTHIGTFLRRPAGYLRGLRWALAYGGWHPVKTAYAVFYFTEALCAGRALERRGHSHFHLHYTSTVGLMISKVFPMTMSMTIHGSGEFIDPAAFRLAEKLHAAAFVLAISYYGKSQMMLHSPAAEWSKLHVVPLGLDTEVYAPADVRERPDPFEVICVGRLYTGKGYELLIEAIATLVRQNRNLRLRMVGDGPEREPLSNLAASLGIAEHVIFEGWRNADEVRRLYAAADAFALPSFAEGVPVVLIEAMAMGLPCVATRITGIPELIRDGVDGLLVTPADVSEIVQALGRLIDDAQLRRRLSGSARARIQEKHNIKLQAEQLSAIFSAQLGASSASAPKQAAHVGRQSL